MNFLVLFKLFSGESGDRHGVKSKKMDVRDERLDPVRSFTLKGFRLEQETWRGVSSGDDSEMVFNSFFNTQDNTHLFIHHQDGGRLCVGLHFPQNVRTKVICVSKTGREVVTKKNVRKILIIQEVQGEDAKTAMIAVSEEVGSFKLMLTFSPTGS